MKNLLSVDEKKTFVLFYLEKFINRVAVPWVLYCHSSHCCPQFLIWNFNEITHIFLSCGIFEGMKWIGAFSI